MNPLEQMLFIRREQQLSEEKKPRRAEHTETTYVRPVPFQEEYGTAHQVLQFLWQGEP